MATTASPSVDRRSPTAPEQILDRIELTVLRRLDGLMQGDHRTLFGGGGLDFTDLRDYQPEDDSRHIDWNVTARMNAPFVRHYVEDRDLTVWFLLDRSPSMAFGGDPDKGRMLTDTVVAFARLLGRGGNRVGAVLWDNTVKSVIEPRSGRNQILRLAEALLAPAADPPGGSRPPTDRTPTALARLGHVALATVQRRSLVFIVSDFVSEPGWERPLTLLAQRHEVVALRIVDPAETDLPNVGIIVVEDAETGEQITVDTSDRAFRHRFHLAAERREQTIRDLARRAGVDLHVISTDDDLVRAILGIAHARKNLARKRPAR